MTIHTSKTIVSECIYLVFNIDSVFVTSHNHGY